MCGMKRLELASFYIDSWAFELCWADKLGTRCEDLLDSRGRFCSDFIDFVNKIKKKNFHISVLLFQLVRQKIPGLFLHSDVSQLTHDVQINYRQ